MTAAPREGLTIRFFAGYSVEAGTYFRVHNLARGLRHWGHDVTVYAVDVDSTSRPRVEHLDGVPYHLLPECRGLQYFGSASHPVTALRRVAAGIPRGEVLHAFQPFLEVAAPWYASRGARIRVFDWDDLWWGGAISGPPDGVASWWMGKSTRLLERTMPRDAAMVTTCSTFLGDLATARGAPHVRVVPNGFWPSAPMTIDDSIVEAKRERRRGLGLEAEAIYAGFMGRTASELAWCADAVQALMEGEPSLRLAVCGPPPEVIDATCRQIRSRVDYLGVLSPERARDFASALDIGLLPLDDNPFNQSRFPIKFAEYLGAGVPVVMSDVGECATLARDWPWVHLAPVGAASFRNTFAAAVAGVRPLPSVAASVDASVVGAVLGWDRIAQQLERAYLDALEATD